MFREEKHLGSPTLTDTHTKAKFPDLTPHWLDRNQGALAVSESYFFNPLFPSTLPHLFSPFYTMCPSGVHFARPENQGRRPLVSYLHQFKAILIISGDTANKSQAASLEDFGQLPSLESPRNRRILF